MTQTLVDVLTTNRLRVTAQRISTLRNTRRHNRSPILEDAGALQSLNEVDVQKELKKNSDDSEGRVLGVGPCVAALHGPRVALVDR